MPSTTTHLTWTVVATAAFSIVGCSDGISQAPVEDAAKIQLFDLDGQPRGLWQASQAGVTVAIFTRSDCPISNRYAPQIRELYKQFQPRGVEIYLIYVDPREQPDAIRAHLAEYENPCPALRDPEHKLVAATGATVTPEAVVFDAARKITYRGRIDNLNAELGTSRTSASTHELADAIDATLDGKPAAGPVTKAVGCIIADLK